MHHLGLLEYTCGTSVGMVFALFDYTLLSQRTATRVAATSALSTDYSSLITGGRKSTP